MIDLNNTWCEATEETEKYLYKNVSKNTHNLNKENIFIIEKVHNELDVKTINYIPNSNCKQIHLVNGEFQYVEPKPKNNFKDYGFEADFEGEILSDIEDYYIGYYIETYPCIKEKQKIPTFWNKYTGTCYKGAGVSNSKYTLKLIKKEWYENHENIGKILKAENTSTKLNELCVFLRLNKDKTITVLGLDGNKFIGFINDFRLATKEEVLYLLVKE